MPRVTFFSSMTPTTQAAVNAGLNAVAASGAITSLTTTRLLQADIWAAQWAIDNGVPFIARGSYLDGAGYASPELRAYGGILISNPDNVATLGTGATITAATDVANKRGKKVNNI